MGSINVNIENTNKFINAGDIEKIFPLVANAHNMLHKGTGAGNGFTGWLSLPVNYDKDEFKRIEFCADRIRKDSDILIVVGIGGSYLGARAVIEALSNSFYQIISKEKRNSPLVLYAGNNLSSSYLNDLIDLIKDREVSLNVISKSGTTTEPAVAFRFLKELMEKKYGKREAVKRIYATTDKNKGALRQLADEEGYETFVIPDNIGGRFSVLTPVGLLPVAVSGVSIKKLMNGAAEAFEKYKNSSYDINPCYLYAAVRNALLKKGKTIEIMVNYEPVMHYFTEWWKQLYGESEGKDKKGIFPAGVDFTTDLHSMGQYIQDGIRNIFETVISVNTPIRDADIMKDDKNLDNLNYLEGKSVDYVNKMAMKGTIMAHVDGGVPNVKINIPDISEDSLGQLIYFFEKACAISGYVLGVNPFNQPGVEAYKKNMFALLGKPGYEEVL